MQQLLVAAQAKFLAEPGGPPTPPVGAKRRRQEYKVQSRYLAHTRSAPYSSGKRW